MKEETTFNYKYSAKENKEIQEIRNHYIPQSESKLEELKRLDSCVQSSGMVQSLSTGLLGILIFGLGLCLAMQILGNGAFFMILGLLLAIVGSIAMFAAYPIYRTVYEKTKAELTPRILELASELSVRNFSAL